MLKPTNDTDHFYHRVVKSCPNAIWLFGPVNCVKKRTSNGLITQQIFDNTSAIEEAGKNLLQNRTLKIGVIEVSLKLLNFLTTY